MRKAIISDIHFTTRFDQKLYDHLKQIFDENDEVVVNGDLWDGFLVTFDQFHGSEWSKLFPLMKQKVVYIYGNHDIPQWQDDRNLDFCKKAVSIYHLELPGGKRLRIEHGHNMYEYTGKTIERYRLLRTIWMIPYKILIRVEKILSDRYGENKYKYIWWEDREKANELLMAEGGKKLGSNDILVTAHTHKPIFAPEKRYINTGSIMHGMSSYLQIEDEQMKMVFSRY